MILFVSLGVSGQFTATMTNTVNGISRVYHVYSNLDQYRYEFVEDGMEGVVIASPQENRVWLLLPEKRFIYKTTSDDIRMLANDPVAAIEMYAAYGEVKKTGNEKVSGYECEVSEYYQGTTKVYTAWYATDLKFIIKATSHISENSFMELSEIKKWKADPSMFGEPEGYTEVDDRMEPKIPEPEPPSSWTSVTLELPINQIFERGTKLQFRVNHDHYTKVKLTNASDTPAKVFYYQSTDGISLPEDKIGPASFRTHRLMSGEFKTLTLNLDRGQEFTVEIHEGMMSIEAAAE